MSLARVFTCFAFSYLGSLHSIDNGWTAEEDPGPYYIWDNTLRRSLVTPMAVTSPPAPAPCMIRGLLPYLLV